MSALLTALFASFRGTGCHIGHDRHWRDHEFLDDLACGFQHASSSVEADQNRRCVLLPRLFQPVSNHLYGYGVHEIGHIAGEDAWLRVEARAIKER